MGYQIGGDEMAFRGILSHLIHWTWQWKIKMVMSVYFNTLGWTW